MSFDLGGFFGGIIGVIGAYGAARYSFNKQMESQKPFRNRKTYELTKTIRNKFGDAWTEFGADDSLKFSGLMKITTAYSQELQTYISEAIETDGRLVKIIRTAVTEFETITQRYYSDEKTYENYLKYENELIGVAVMQLKECQKIIDEIVNSHLEP